MATIRTPRWMAAIGILLVLVAAPRARAQEVEVPLNQVPKAVLDAGKSLFPSATLREASKETENGKLVYELAMTQGTRHMDVTFQENGTLVLVESAVPETEVPPAVLRAVQQKYPGAKIGLVESVKKGPRLKRDADYYEFHLTAADKTSVEVEVDAHGKILQIEEKKAQDEKDGK